MKLKNDFLASLCLITLLVGCDYTVPLVETPTLSIDPAVAGVWRKAGTTQDQSDQLLILPIDAKRFLVSFPSGDENAMFAEAIRADVNDLQLIQLKWFGTAKGSVPDDDRVYQYLRYSLEDGKLSIQLLNKSVISDNVKIPDELRQEIIDHKHIKNLFKKKMTFVKVPQPKR